MTEKRATLTFKAGDREIGFEADRETVEARLDHILDRFFGDASDVEVTLTGATGQERPVEDEPPAVPESERLAQLFAVGGKRVTLRQLPESAADALLLVLYGTWKLRRLTWVTAPGMTSAARASGVRFDRADRLLAQHPELWEGTGRKRSRRYRLTAAGREHCQRLVESLAGPFAVDETTDEPPPEAESSPVDDVQPSASVREHWTEELLSAAEVAERLGEDIDLEAVAAMRRDSKLLGLMSGSRQTRRFFYPAFQIDTEHRRIYPEVRRVNELFYSSHDDLGTAGWWSSVEPELGARPMDLVGTPEAEAVVRAAEARTARGAKR